MGLNYQFKKDLLFQIVGLSKADTSALLETSDNLTVRVFPTLVTARTYDKDGNCLSGKGFLLKKSRLSFTAWVGSQSDMFSRGDLAQTLKGVIVVSGDIQQNVQGAIDWLARINSIVHSVEFNGELRISFNELIRKSISLALYNAAEEKVESIVLIGEA